jgi:hypothetical protein
MAGSWLHTPSSVHFAVATLSVIFEIITLHAKKQTQRSASLQYQTEPAYEKHSRNMNTCLAHSESADVFG